MSQALQKSAVVATLSALLEDELATLRQSDGLQSKGLHLTAATRLTLAQRAQNHPDEILIDSFEWMALATRVVNFFCLDSSGIEDYLLRRYTIGEWAEIVLQSRELGTTDIRFTTSGSTGSPKVICHRYESIMAEAEFFSERLRTRKNPPQRIVSLVPAHHIYGFLFSVLLPQLLDIQVTRGLKSFSLVFGGRLQQGDVVIAFPSMLQEIAQRQVSMGHGVRFICSTGPCPAEAIDALQACQAAEVLEVYGSTDTAGIGWRETPADPYQLLPRWRRTSTTALYDEVLQFAVELPDHLVWVDQSRFRPQQRRDQAVAVNGVNVFPQRIAEVLIGHPQVKDARVRLLGA